MDQHVYLQVSRCMMGSTAHRVNVDQIRNFQLALPPHEKPKAIVGHVGAECSMIDTTIIRLEREIDLLREYRTRLVADVVTGRLDVRPAAARLPADLSPVFEF